MSERGNRLADLAAELWPSKVWWTTERKVLMADKFGAVPISEDQAVSCIRQFAVEHGDIRNKVPELLARLYRCADEPTKDPKANNRWDYSAICDFSPDHGPMALIGKNLHCPYCCGCVLCKRLIGASHE